MNEKNQQKLLQFFHDISQFLQWLSFVSAQIFKRIPNQFLFENLKFHFWNRLYISVATARESVMFDFVQCNFLLLILKVGSSLEGKVKLHCTFSRQKIPQNFSCWPQLHAWPEKKKYLQRTTTAAPTFTLSLQGSK